MKIYWVGFTQKFEEGNWRNGYYNGLIEAENPSHALELWYGECQPPDLIQVFEHRNEEWILVHTAGLH